MCKLRHTPSPLPVCQFPCVPSFCLPSRYLNSVTGFSISSPHHLFSTVTSFSQEMGFIFGWRPPGKGLSKITWVGLSRQSPASPQPLHPIGVLAMWEGQEGPCRWTVGDRCDLGPFVGLSVCLQTSTYAMLCPCVCACMREPVCSCWVGAT